MVEERAENDHASDRPGSIGESKLERFRADREVEFLQSPFDSVLEEKLDQHFARRSAGELDVERGLVPDEAAPKLEPEVKGERSAVEQDHVEPEPAAREELHDQL